MTNWVTIKIPEATRDKAKADSRTYQEIIEAGLGESVAGETVDPQAIVEQVQQQIDATAFNGGMSDEKADEILGKLDDLRSQLPSEVAREVKQR